MKYWQDPSQAALCICSMAFLWLGIHFPTPLGKAYSFFISCLLWAYATIPHPSKESVVQLKFGAISVILEIHDLIAAIVLLFYPEYRHISAQEWPLRRWLQEKWRIAFRNYHEQRIKDSKTHNIKT